MLNKPAPLPMHAGGRFYRNTLQQFSTRLIIRRNRTRRTGWTRTRRAWCWSRARVILPASCNRNSPAGEVEKLYLVCVQGQPPEDVFSCDAPISEESGELGSRIVDMESRLDARTEFRVRKRNSDGTALLEARPLTGRTNQIRVHLWHLGFPVCGDLVYLPGKKIGDTQTLAVGDSPLCLHAWQIKFVHPMSKQPMTFTAPPPDWAV